MPNHTQPARWITFVPSAAKPKKSAAPKPRPHEAEVKRRWITFVPQEPARKLTAAQRKRLAATGRVTVKRGGKFVTITR